MKPPTKTFRYEPDYVLHPGATLRECLLQDWGTISTGRHVAAAIHGIPEDAVDAILAGEQPIDEDTAHRLFGLTQIPARFWLSLEHNFREGLAAGKSWEP